MRELMRIVFFVTIGGIGGIAFVIFTFLGLGLISKAFGQDAVPTYEARSSQQDRSLNYKSPRGNVPDSNYPEYIEVGYVTLDDGCDQLNASLLAKVQMIATEIAKNPSVGYIYVGALNTIHGLWCIK